VVELLPSSGAPAQRVAAGEHAYLRADDGDESERAVRAAIEQKLRSLDGVAEAPDAFQPDMDLSEAVLLEPSSSARPSRAIARKLEAARRLLRQGRHAAARQRLRGLAESGIAVRFRVEALTLIAESYTAQGDVQLAAKAYRRADELSPGDPAGHNARFALARLLERYAHDEVAAVAAYKHYLARAPRGALAAQARQALCRLDQREFCSER
jgi:tetratricopeptide (TPR) repeat protein